EPPRSVDLPAGFAGHLHLRSFPTRRSSDLSTNTGPVENRVQELTNIVWGGRDIATAVREVPSSTLVKIQLLAGVSSEKNKVNDQDRKSTRLNSSHVKISYAVFCLKKKKNTH